MIAVFKVATPFNQADGLMIHYENSNGLCNGLVLEYARHHLIHQMKGTPTYFMKKLKANTINPSANFLERVKGYNDSTYFLGDKVYRADDELLKLLDDHTTSENRVLKIGFSAISTTITNAHAIALKIEHKESYISYTIFDPNFGESIEYTAKQDCAAALTHLKKAYLIAWGCENLSVTALDLSDILHELSIIPMDRNYTKNSKYGYQLIEAIINKDLAKVHGELGAKTKIDYKSAHFNTTTIDNENYIFSPKNIIDLAILELDEPDLIKLININTQIDLEKSLVSTLVHLAMTDKDTPAVLDALIAKLPLENYECRKVLEVYKAESTNPGHDEMSEPTPTEKWLMNEYLKEVNSFINKDISLYSDTDIDYKHLYVTEEGELVEDRSVIDLYSYSHS
ncbi:MAG: hypothetical protein K0R73_42 [Candidatus Midichloriaceae bacterium]|jgi:hypothetical protein|nr:hypothetical protein [Candidatus Midichloriaceae bacterium]